MQSAQSPSPWPKRIMIIGLGLVIVGIISAFTYASGFTDYYDPRIVSEHTAEINEVNSFELEEGCWVVYVEGEKGNYEVEFNFVEDGTIGAKIPTDCNTDFTAQASDTDFGLVSKLNIESDSEVTVSINCDEEDACNNKLHFVNGDEVVYDMITDAPLLVTCAFCLTGLILIPIGWLITVINKGHAKSVELVQNPAVVTPDEYEDGLMSTPQDMLTTDDLYRLVRGELPQGEDPSQDVPSPFTDSDTRVTSRVSTPVKKNTGGSINRASSYTPENLPKDESWKNWDEG